MRPLAYTVFWDTKHVKGETYDANLVPFDGWEYVFSWYTTRSHQVPDRICFDADFSITQHSDYPFNDVLWPLMSPRMIEALRSVGDFPHRAVPVQFINRKVPRSKRHLRDGSLRPEVVDDRFAAVQLLEHIDVVDWERSVFTRSTLDPDEVAHFDELVLKDPPGGLPALFRIPSHISFLFVSAAAYEALQAAGIRGVEFQPVYGANA